MYYKTHLRRARTVNRLDLKNGLNQTVHKAEGERGAQDIKDQGVRKGVLELLGEHVYLSLRKGALGHHNRRNPLWDIFYEVVDGFYVIGDGVVDI